MSYANSAFAERYKVVDGLNQTVPSSSTPDYVSLKNALRCTVILTVSNTTAVTGSAITLKQATAVAGTSEKALAFSTVRQNIDTGASDTLTEATVSSNTFTTDSTNSKNLMYVIDVDPATLDVTNGFDCIRLGTANATNARCNVVYLLEMKQQKTTPAAVITD